MLVEDESEHVTLIKRAFTKYHGPMRLSIASSLQEAQEHLTGALQDLIIADMFLPDGTGLELIPRDKENHNIPLVVMTSKGDEKIAVDALKRGALDYVVKSADTLADMPHIAERSLREWEHILEKKQAETALRAANQQLRASEQQLQSANQQLRASINQLRLNEEQLRQSEQNYRSIFETAASLIILVNKEGIIIDCNSRVKEILAYNSKEIIGRDYETIIHPECLSQARIDLAEIFIKGVGINKEYKMVRRDQNVIDVRINSSALTDESGHYDRTISVISDITYFKQAQEQLRREKDKARQYLDVAGTIFLVIDADQKVSLINKKGCQVLGCKEKDVIRKNWFDNFIPENIRPKTKDVFYRLMAGEIRLVEYYENVVMTRTGEERIIAWHNTLLRNEEGEPAGTLSSGQDITERIKTQEKLFDYQKQLQSLTSELSLAEERQRQRIANQLHDRIGQSLVLSKMNLDALRAAQQDKSKAEALKDISEMIGNSIADIRSLTFDLGSPILHELGLEPALAELLDELFHDKNKISTKFEDDGKPKPLSEDVRILLFQVVKELLVNVIKHAQATKVMLSIRAEKDKVCIVATDNGIGFDPAQTSLYLSRSGGFGLFSIRERLSHLGGTFDIDSQQRQGTKIIISAPLNARGGKRS